MSLIRHITGSIVQVRAVSAEDSTMAEINQFALTELKESDVAVFQLDLCNDQIDRHYSRFPANELAKINEMVRGRPLMERHDMRGSLPRGVFFRSELATNNGIMSVRPTAYMLRSEENADFIRNIEGGVYRETSIGFSFKTPTCSVCSEDIRSCSHIPGRDYKGSTCHYVMNDVTDVIEGSIVPAGSQGTKIVAQLRGMGEADEFQIGEKDGSHCNEASPVAVLVRSCEMKLRQLERVLL